MTSRQWFTSNQKRFKCISTHFAHCYLIWSCEATSVTLVNKNIHKWYLECLARQVIILLYFNTDIKIFLQVYATVYLHGCLYNVQLHTKHDIYNMSLHNNSQKRIQADFIWFFCPLSNVFFPFFWFTQTFDEMRYAHIPHRCPGVGLNSQAWNTPQLCNSLIQCQITHTFSYLFCKQLMKKQ